LKKIKPFKENQVLFLNKFLRYEKKQSLVVTIGFFR
jgi:hypothetical protein